MPTKSDTRHEEKKRQRDESRRRAIARDKARDDRDKKLHAAFEEYRVKVQAIWLSWKNSR